MNSAKRIEELEAALKEILTMAENKADHDQIYGKANLALNPEIETVPRAT